jgi:hypothetical protein
MYHRKLHDRTDLRQHPLGSFNSPMHQSPTLLARENRRRSVLANDLMTAVAIPAATRAPV